jgi:hypothetical protein
MPLIAPSAGASVPARTISSPLIAAVAYLLFSVFIFIFKGPQAASRFP